MKNEFPNRVDGHKIYVDQLRNGRVEKIEENLAPLFLEINETDLVFEDLVHVKGEAYVADGNLVLHLAVATEAKLPCSICNQLTKTAVVLPKFYYTESLENIKGGIFSMFPSLREAILLETPSYAECNEGHCPQRKDIEKFIKKPSPSKQEGTDTYRPFEGLKLD